MTSSFPPNVGNKFFLVSKDATPLTGGLNLTYPFDGFSIEVLFTANPTAGETITIGSTAYEFVAAGSIPATNNDPNDVEIGANWQVTADNLRQALIDGNAVPGDEDGQETDYGAGTVANPDILHAEFGTADDGTANVRLHITANSAVACSTTAPDDVTLVDLDGNTLTAMVHYPQGDFTELKANSSTANATQLTITGIAPANLDETANLADCVVKIYTHSGLPLMALTYDAGAGTFGMRYAPVTLTEGIAGKLSVRTNEDTGVYVFYH
jgi:hypothetical protein